MKEWGFAQVDPSDHLAQLHMFSMCKKHAKGEIDVVITVREYVTPRDPATLFFAQTDKEFNQKTAPLKPTGWGRDLFSALSACVKAIHRFPYEGPEAE